MKTVAMLNAAHETRSSISGVAAAVCNAFRESNLCVFVLDEKLRLCGANLAAEALLGNDWRGQPLDPKVSAELFHVATRVRSSGHAQTLELSRFPHSGLSGCWDVECVPLLAEHVGSVDERGVVVVMRDDGERQALRRQLERSNRSESLGRLAGSIAHDFNNLLTGIRGSIALARQNRSPASLDGALRAADLAAQRAAEMTRQLLAFSRGPAYVPPRADAEAVLIEASELIGCMPDGAQVELDLDADLGKADVTSAELHQVVLNLLMNARDALKRSPGPGRILLSAARVRGADPGHRDLEPNPFEASNFTTSEFETHDDEGGIPRWLRVTVADTGPGMDPATRRRVFEPFFTTKAGHEGTGLGLSSVRDIVERAGGWIDVQSELAQGATFNVYLPLQAEGVEMTLPRVQGRPPKKDHVLICDDESRLASLTAGLLQEFGYNPTAVGAGEDALNLMRTGASSVDVLLLDVNLSSGVTAHDVLETMKREGLDSPVILTSGFAPEDVPEMLRLHDRVASYLPKPYTVSELVAAISRAVEGRVSR